MLTSGLGNPLFLLKEPSGQISNEWNTYSIHCPGLLRNPQAYENGIIEDKHFDIWPSVLYLHQGVKFELLKPGDSKPYANIYTQEVWLRSPRRVLFDAKTKGKKSHDTGLVVPATELRRTSCSNNHFSKSLQWQCAAHSMKKKVVNMVEGEKKKNRGYGLIIFVDGAWYLHCICFTSFHNGYISHLHSSSSLLNGQLA